MPTPAAFLTCKYIVNMWNAMEFPFLHELLVVKNCLYCLRPRLYVITIVPFRVIQKDILARKPGHALNIELPLQGHSGFWLWNSPGSHNCFSFDQQLCHSLRCHSVWRLWVGQWSNIIHHRQCTGSSHICCFPFHQKQHFLHILEKILQLAHLCLISLPRSIRRTGIFNRLIKFQWPENFDRNMIDFFHHPAEPNSKAFIQSRWPKPPLWEYEPPSTTNDYEQNCYKWSVN